MKYKDKRLFLKSPHSFLDKNSVNERALFPKVYASRGGSRIFQRGATFVKEGGGGGGDCSLSDQQNM